MIYGHKKSFNGKASGYISDNYHDSKIVLPIFVRQTQIAPANTDVGRIVRLSGWMHGRVHKKALFLVESGFVYMDRNRVAVLFGKSKQFPEESHFRRACGSRIDQRGNWSGASGRTSEVASSSVKLWSSGW